MSNLLKKVWECHDLEDILTAGLDYNAITSSDIINASNMYKNPNKEYTDEDIKEMISFCGIENIMKIIENEYGVEDIIENISVDDILDPIPDNEILDYLKGSWTIEDYKEDIKEEYREELLEDVTEQVNAENENYKNNIINLEGDDLHHLICDIVGCTYYDNNVSDKFKEKLNKNSYGIKY